MNLFIISGNLLMKEGQKDSLSIFNYNTIDLPVVNIQAVPINFNDTIPSDTLFIKRSAEGFPISYSRKIQTGVCIEGKCRSVNIVLHWTITGRYLGFELPQGEI